ncbi:ATP-dependent DNA helicase chl1 [Globomyces sp. JEL0801]|nr:ATP-dependent DNA helicase chl1 [Globomyces sp. JEL0801]
MLNPSQSFQDIVEESRSVVFAGGTMEPISEFVTELVPYLDCQKLHFFSCGHVIPKEQLVTISLSHGPGGVEFDFRHGNRDNPKMTGAILLAVVGGKLSEGINFSDDNKEARRGSEYYENLCMKAV